MHNRAFFVLLGFGLAIGAAQAQGFYKANITLGEEEIIFNSTEVMVDTGDTVELTCGVKGLTEGLVFGANWTCVWMNMKTNKTQERNRTLNEEDPCKIAVKNIQRDEEVSYQVLDVYKGVFNNKRKPDNTSENQCGIILNSIQNEDNGVWRCSILVPGRHLYEYKNIVVKDKPTQFNITSNNAHVSDIHVNEGDERKYECTVEKSRPPAKITWKIGDKNITENVKENIVDNEEEKIKIAWKEKEQTDGSNKRPENTKPGEEKNKEMVKLECPYKVRTGDFKTISTLTHEFSKSEDNSMLKCVIDHPTLENQKSLEIPITVGGAPIVIEKKFYSAIKGRNYKMEFQYKASPTSTRKWKIGDFENVHAFNASGKYMAVSNNTAEPDTYDASLEIFNIIDDDFKKDYIFQVITETGNKTFYKFNLFEGENSGGNYSVNPAWFLYTVLSLLAIFL